MKISVITATYNSEISIASALHSIEQQDHQHIEVLLIDGKSKDNTIKVAKRSFSGDLRIICEKDRGIYDALNKGILHASGDVVGFVHSDDLLASSETISDILKVFEEKQVDGVYGDLQYVKKEDPSKIVRYWKSQPFRSQLLNNGWMPAHPSLFLRREVYEKHGFFNTKYNIAADYDFMLRIFQDNSLRFHYLPQVITKMRVGGASNRSIKNIVQKSSEDFRVLRANKINNPIKVLLYKNLTKISQFKNSSF